MKKSLSLILSVMLIAATLFALPFNALAEEKSIKDESITVKVTSCKFSEETGIIYDVDVEVKDGDTVLVKGTDYEVECDNDGAQILKSGKTSAYYIIEGIGAYTGYRSGEFSAVAPTKGKSDNTKWVFDTKKQFLRIGGKGTLKRTRTGDAKYVYIDGVSAIQNYWAYIYADTYERVDFKNITITGKVQTIGENAFYYIKGIKNLNLQSGVKTLKKGALATSPDTLKSVYIPKSVTKIGKGAVGYAASRGYADNDDIIYKYSKIKGFVIIGESGSAAQKYAKKNKIKFVALKPSKVNKVKAGKKGFTATWKKAKGASGYQIQYSTNKYFAAGNKAVKVKGAKNLKKTVKKLKAGKYYVRIRTYKTVKKKTYYSNWSTAKAVTVK